MKTFVGLGLLVLLLSHTLGLSLAQLCLGKAFRHPKDVAQSIEVSQARPSAWHTFAELSERMLETDLAKTPPTPLRTILKMMNDLAKSYLPVRRITGERMEEEAMQFTAVRFAETLCMPVKGILNRATPPPEMIG